VKIAYAELIELNSEELKPKNLATGLSLTLEGNFGYQAFMVVLGSDSDKCTSCKHSDSNFSRDAGSRPQEILGVAKTSSFQLPKKISQLVLEDHLELGHADDRVFNRVNSKQGSGTVGVLTNSMITRTLYYDHALKLALIPFMWPELYIS